MGGMAGFGNGRHPPLVPLGVLGELPALIASVAASLNGLVNGGAAPAEELQKPAVSIKKSVAPRLHHLARNRKTIQVAQAPSHDQLRHDEATNM
jgi:hypothetical protein